jgi:Tol biopolymer transport system component
MSFRANEAFRPDSRNHSIVHPPAEFIRMIHTTSHLAVTFAIAAMLSGVASAQTPIEVGKATMHPDRARDVAAGFGALDAKVPNPIRINHVVHAYAVFTPSGDRLIYQSNAGGNWDLFSSKLDGTDVQRITSNPAADITPMCSPDGKRLAFVSERAGSRDVFVSGLDGSNPNRLTTEDASDIHPFWSADGTRILFSSNRGKSDPNDFDIYEMNADGTGVRQITSGPEVDTYASWSPDGSHIVTRRVINGDNEVFLLDPDGGNPVNLTNNPRTYDGWPVWSPDGSRIAFASGVPNSGTHYIFSMKPDGTDKVQLSAPLPWIDWNYDTQPSFSFDGKRLAFTKYRPGMLEISDIFVIHLDQAAS